MRLSEDVYLVGGGSFNGFGLSDDMDSHIYALDGGSEIALIDCGMASKKSIEKIYDNLSKDGLDPQKIKHIFITHYHIDHCGGLKKWQEQLSVETYISSDAVKAIETGDTTSTGFALAQQGGLYPLDYFFEPAKITKPLNPGDKFSIGSLMIEYIPSPGHCSGHSAYLVKGAKKYLFTGDCVFANGIIALLNTKDSNIDLYRSTIFELEKLDFDAMLPGHGSLMLSDGKQHLKIAADAFRTLTLPRNFV